MTVSIDRAFLVVFNQTLQCFKSNYINKFLILLALLVAFVNLHYLFFYKLIHLKNQSNNENMAVNTNIHIIFDQIHMNPEYEEEDNVDLSNITRFTKDLKESMQYKSACQSSDIRYNYFITKIWTWIGT
jgi:hypothetical protein